MRYYLSQNKLSMPSPNRIEKGIDFYSKSSFSLFLSLSSHVAQDGLTLYLRMTLIFQSPCLHLQSAEITGTPPMLRFIQCWELPRNFPKLGRHSTS